MSIEIERKFLVISDEWGALAGERISIEQGYLNDDSNLSVRVRIKNENAAKLTFKTRQTGIVRSEFEYDIPIEDARQLLILCGSATVRKYRHLCQIGSLLWEVDVFSGKHQGLTLAEVELSSEDQQIELPRWIGREVTEDPRYRNDQLARSSSS